MKIRDLWKIYREQTLLEKKEKRLLAKDMDYAFLQKIVNEVDSKGVEIKITLNDHTELLVKPIKKYRGISNEELFNGEDIF